jgi:flagellar biosynthesis protein FlhA
MLIFTNLPAIPLLTIGGGCMGLAYTMTRKTKETAAQQAEQAKVAEATKPTQERIEDYLLIDPMEMEIGVGLIRLADPKRGGDLLERIQGVRQQMAGDIGIIIPKVRIRDNFRLDQNQYRVKIADMPVAQGVVYPGMFLAIDSGMTAGKVHGIPTTDPAFGTPAVWIDAGTREQAELLGYTVVEPVTVLATHLTEVVRRHADELLTRDATKHLIAQLKETSPAVVEELIPSHMKLAEVQQILQMLLREQVPIRQLSAILETLGDHCTRSKDPILLTEYVRNRLARSICTRYRDKENRLYVVSLDPALEDRIRAGIDHTEKGMFIRMSPQAVEFTCQKISGETEKLTRIGKPPVVLVSPQIRAGLKQLTASTLPNLVVLSYAEVTRDTVIESLGMVADGASR